MAVHTGAPELREGDYFGLALNRVARLRDAAHGGQILVSLAAEELVRDALPEGTSLRTLGEHRLRDLTRPERVFQILDSRLPDDFPPLRTLDTLPNNLPRHLTSFVGRRSDVAEVRQLITEAPLVTLSGPGGVGKTRLCLQVAAEQLDMYADGAWLVEFETLNDDWMNRTSGPERAGSHDLLVGQSYRAPRTGLLQAGTAEAELRTDRHWVVPTGGGYFFAPSISALRLFAED